MSLAIRRSKMRGDYRGDPGLFDFFKKAATIGTSFIPFVGPTISQAIAQSGGGGPGTTPAVLSSAHRGQHMTGSARTLEGHYAHGHRGMIERARAGQAMPGPAAALQRFLPFGETGRFPAMAANGMAMGPQPKGYQLNKSSYFLMSGEFVPAGSRYVKIRRRNPANARATSRAISRIGGAKTYAKTLGRISIRKKC